MKVALVLSGGGAKGSMQFGILKYLCEQGLKPDAVYGTSVGSLNACGLSYVGIDGLEQVWGSIKKKSDVFKFNWSSLLFRSKGLFNSRPLKKKIDQVVAGRNPSIPAFACKVSLVTGEIAYSQSGDSDYAESVLASSSIPALVDPVGEWVDGGAREQTPLKKAILDGADKIVVIMCNPYQDNPDKSSVRAWPLNLLRVTDIISHEIFKNDVDSCLWYNRKAFPGKKYVEIEIYAPRKLVIDTSEFTQDKIRAAIAYGYECGKLGPILTDKSEV